MTVFNTAAGTRVVLTGTNLSSVTNVTVTNFFGPEDVGPENTGFTKDSPTQITVRVPSDAITGPIGIFSPGGFAAGPNDLVITPVAVPHVSTVTPLNGTVGSTVVLTGINLKAPLTKVLFNGISTNFTVDSPTQIRATVPAGVGTGSVTVSVITAGGIVYPSCQVLRSMLYPLRHDRPAPGSGNAGSAIILPAPICRIPRPCWSTAYWPPSST